MTISSKDWQNYISRLRKLSTTASDSMSEYIRLHGIAGTESLIDYAQALVRKYGEGSSELACQMYDAIAEMEKAAVSSAVPAEISTLDETAKAINGSLIQSETGQKIASVVDRLVKQAAADTICQNAIRDGAYWAWIPSGDTCAFCITLASRGWQRASKRAMKGNHAQHIHSNCDCQYCIRFNGNTNVAGYDPNAYLDMYNASDGSSQDKINAMRRIQYAKNKEKITAQQRAAYAIRTGKDDEE